MNKKIVFASLIFMSSLYSGHSESDLRKDWQDLQYSPHYILGITPFDEMKVGAARRVCEKHGFSLELWKQLHKKLTTPRALSFFWGLEAFTEDELCINQKLKIKDADGNTVLMGAAFNGRKTLLEKLLSLEGADIKAKNKSGNTVRDYISENISEPSKLFAALGESSRPLEKICG